MAESVDVSTLEDINGIKMTEDEPEPEEVGNTEQNDENMDDSTTVTMVDVLNEQQELQENADAVLGGSDAKNCTYPKGYLKRQALYACITCIPESRTDPLKRAGICLACSYYCHEGHELIELYTKRNFRCDCGNGKFPDRKCNLEPEKSDGNELNIYSHNFSGLYCTCARPYPDPDDKTEDEMMQCIVCEDWLHLRHLGCSVPAPNSYAEMVCSGCITKHEFLLNYSSSFATSIVKTEGGAQIKMEKADTDEEVKVDDKADAGPNEIECKMPTVRTDFICAKFWPDGWRLNLCTCKKCVELYERENVSYLIDIQDTVHCYEEKGKAKADEQNLTQYDQCMDALSSLNRVQQIEAISEYNIMKESLKEYLQKFAESKKVVREEDIREFFTGLAAKKKQRVEVPYFCR